MIEPDTAPNATPIVVAGVPLPRHARIEAWAENGAVKIEAYITGVDPTVTAAYAARVRDAISDGDVPPGIRVAVDYAPGGDRVCVVLTASADVLAAYAVGLAAGRKHSAKSA